MSDEPSDSNQHAQTAGWHSSFPSFRSSSPRVIRTSLEQFVADASTSQVHAWDDTIPRLQAEAGEVLDSESRAEAYTAVLEYKLPLEARRTDAIFLMSGSVVVIELKGKKAPNQADIDQAAAYARDLRAYHRECQDREVHAILVPTLAGDAPRFQDGVWVSGPHAIDGLVRELTRESQVSPPEAEAFLADDAYRPLPTLVQAARELFHSGEVREVWRARAATDPAVSRLVAIAHDAARTRTRRLLLITGVPGSGKTLVGMRAVHARFLDDLAVERKAGKPTAPGLFLSGNGPLVTVLQHVLRAGGGGGRTFVRHIKDYLDAYVPRPERVPPEHLLVFDEAQRAFTVEKVQDLHDKWPAQLARSEPQHFIDICERIPEWSVLVGLIGTGQEIHVGEEGGLAQWREALEAAAEPGRWTVHAPPDVEEVFSGSSLRTIREPALDLDKELRFHLAANLHKFVKEFLEREPSQDQASGVAEALRKPSYSFTEGVRLWATRDLDIAKQYLWDRYADQPDARFGLLASSRDRLLESYGINNDWRSTSRVRLGPWYADGSGSPDSCRNLTTCVTEFGAQGLELDMVLLAWGSDFVRDGGHWSDAGARRYKGGAVKVQDPFRLRLNAYRVLLTRGRDGTLVFVPPEAEMEETWIYLLDSGFRELPS